MEQSYYHKISVYRWGKDGKTLRMLGERVCERWDMHKKMVFDILKEAGSPNKGEIIIMHGETVRIFKNGINIKGRSALYYDNDDRLAEHIHAKRLLALADAYKDFMGEKDVRSV